MDLLNQSFIDCTNGVTDATNAKQIGSFDKWRRFLEGIGINDVFLIEFTQVQRIALICAFASAIRRNEYGKTSKSKLRSGTISSTISDICSTYRTNLRDDPTLEEGGTKYIFLKRMLRGFDTEDPQVKHQKCLPLSVFKSMWENNKTVMSQAIGQLINDYYYALM